MDSYRDRICCSVASNSDNLGDSVLEKETAEYEVPGWAMNYIPTEEDYEAVGLLQKRDDLTQWEEEFIASLVESGTWSQKMADKLNELFEMKFSGGGSIR